MYVASRDIILSQLHIGYLTREGLISLNSITFKLMLIESSRENSQAKVFLQHDFERPDFKISLSLLLQQRSLSRGILVYCSTRSFA